MKMRTVICFLFYSLFICNLSAQLELQQTNLFIGTDSLKISVMPPIIGLTPINVEHDKILIAFYDSDCNKCVNEMARLIQFYQQLKNQNIRVVSISADINEERHKYKTSDFPWKDDLCDYKGVNGINFVNYDVFATPVFYLIDKERKLLGVYFNISDLQNELLSVY